MADPERILVPALVITVPAIGLHVLIQYLLGITFAGSRSCLRTFLGTALQAQCGPSNGRAETTLALGLFALLVLIHLVTAGLNRAVLDALSGAEPRGPFQGWNWSTTLPTALILGLVLTVGSIALFIPALVIAFFSRYAMVFAVEGHGVKASITGSVDLVTSNVGSELWFFLRAAVVVILGAAALGVGLYAAIPIVLIAQADRFRVYPGLGSGETASAPQAHR